jgi:hypothetical protein
MDAICIYSEKYDCFDNICTGALAFNETTIGCNQDSHHCTLNSTGYPQCINAANGTSGAGVFCKDHFSCKQDKETGVASCKTSHGLLPLYIVIGIIAVVVVVGIVVWVVRKRMAGADDRQSLLNRETGY